MTSANDSEIADATDRVVVLGRISGAFGVSGWIKIESYTDPPDRLLSYSKNWLLQRGPGQGETGWVALKILQARMTGQAVHAQPQGVVTREQAAELRGALLGVRRSEMPSLRPGEYYWDDLIGLEAVTPNEEPLGEIVEIRMTPAHPLLRLIEKRRDDSRSTDKLAPRRPVESGSIERGSIERWVPLVRERIVAVSLVKRRAVLDWQRDW